MELEIINYVVLGIGFVGTFVILWGALITLIEFLANESKRFSKQNIAIERTRIRYYFSSYLLMGLEYMIGADIIRTITRPTLQELAIVGALVAIRTVISYFLNQEMEKPLTRKL
jgi:uncharacterized membrane protein